MIDWLVNSLECLIGIEGYEALDRNLRPWCNTLLLWLIPGDLFRAYSHRQFHTLSCLLHSQAAVSKSYTNACVLSREAVCTILMMVFSMTRPGREHIKEVDMLTTKLSQHCRPLGPMLCTVAYKMWSLEKILVYIRYYNDLIAKTQ